MSDLWVDFNEVDSNYGAYSLLKFATPGLDIQVGKIYRAGDYEGNSALATVASIYPDSGLIKLVLAMDTFESEES